MAKKNELSPDETRVENAERTDGSRDAVAHQQATTDAHDDDGVAATLNQGAPAQTEPLELTTGGTKSSERTETVRALQNHDCQIGAYQIAIKKGNEYKLPASVVAVLSNAGVVMKK